MKKLFLLLLFLINTSVFSQSLERQDEIKFSVSGIISKIDYAIGWNKNLSGSWVKFDRIDYDQPLNLILRENDKVYSNGFYSSRNSNFYSISKHEVNYPGQETMIMIIVDFLDGYYEYPILREDWQAIRSYSVYLISKEEINKFYKNYHKKLNQTKTYKIKTIRADLFEEALKFTNAEMLAKAKYSYPFKITLQPLNDENNRIVRFSLAKYFHAGQPPMGVTKFENNYFEIDWDDFQDVFSDL